VTTIAWRIGHLGGLALGGFANRRFGDGTLTPEGLDFPAQAAAVNDFVTEHYGAWREGLADSISPAGTSPWDRLGGRFPKPTRSTWHCMSSTK
jgi:hypothetical protein